MQFDFAPYDAATPEYQDAEGHALTIRLIQGLPDGEKLSQDELEAALRWLVEFQRNRDVLALVLKGLARMRVIDGEVGFQALEGEPFAPLSECTADGALDSEWLEARLDLDEHDEGAPA